MEEYISVIIVVFCLGVAFIVRTSLDFIDNKYIPLILGIIGISSNVFYEKAFTLPIIVVGLQSGIAAIFVYDKLSKKIQDRKTTNK